MLEGLKKSLFNRDQEVQEKRAYIQEHVTHTRWWRRGEEKIWKKDESKRERRRMECDWKIYDLCVNTGS